MDAILTNHLQVIMLIYCCLMTLIANYLLLYLRMNTFLFSYFACPPCPPLILSVMLRAQKISLYERSIDTFMVLFIHIQNAWLI